MKKHFVYIEIEGTQTYVGNIRGDNSGNARFAYDRDFLNSSYSMPISISLPLQEEPFSVMQTRNFFEGLLPEGFTRRTVAGWLHVDENDYISILSALGQECLGAIQILEEGVSIPPADYEQLSLEQVKAIAKEGASKSAELVTKSHLSLTGASGKVGLMFQDGVWYQPKSDAPSTHIIKQSHVRLNNIVLNEQLSLMTAKELGIKVSESFIINLNAGADEDVLFASKRYDRVLSEHCNYIGTIRRPIRLHQEDFAQALGKASADKYEKLGDSYLAKMFGVLRKYSNNPVEDSLKLWDMIIFDFLIGNTDNHIKNHALLYDMALRKIRLAPAYDIVSTSVYNSSIRNMAFHIGGKYSLDEIGRDEFAAAAMECGMGERLVLQHFDKMVNAFEMALKISTEQLAAQGLMQAYDLEEKILNTCGYASVLRNSGR